jgi:hypothetical protein
MLSLQMLVGSALTSTLLQAAKLRLLQEQQEARLAAQRAEEEQR